MRFPRAIEPAHWLLAAIVVLLVVFLWFRLNVPDEARARRDFLSENPTFTVERVENEEEEVGFISHRVFYRVPHDSKLRDQLLQYEHSDGQWRIFGRVQER
jgi:hypothetical protein